MPRLKRRAARKRRAVQISDCAFAYLSDEKDYERAGDHSFEVLDLEFPTVGNRMEKFTRLWGAVSEEIIERWIVEHPGTRPRAWWRVDAPADEYRRRIGGTATPIHECLGYVPHFEYGIPGTFMDADTLAHYDEHHDGLENVEHPGERVAAFDPDDPPRYESQCRYLWDRHLLSPKEKKAVEKLGLLGAVETVEQQPEIKIMKDGRLLTE